MKYSFKLLLIIGIIMSMGSCNSDLGENESFIFGSFAGECFGDRCVQIYKLNDEGLWEDKNDNYPGSNFTGEQFSFEILSDSKFELVEGFANQFPKKLLDETEDRIGCPDCYDQGGIYVEWNKDGEQGSWTIDVTKEDVPEYLHDFLDDLFEKLKLLNQ